MQTKFSGASLFRLMTIFIFFYYTILMVATGHAQSNAPAIETYGFLPSVRALEISPDGNALGYIINTDDGKEAVQIFDLKARQLIGGVRTDEVQANYITIPNKDFALLHVSEKTRVFGTSNKYDYSAAFAYNLNTKKIRQLLRGTKGLYPAQSGLGRVVGVSDDGETLYMPAFMGGSNPNYSLLRVSLKTGRGRVLSRGRSFTKDWFVDLDGTVLAREDFDDNKDIYSIWAGRDGKLEKIVSINSEIPPMSLVGIKVDRSALIVSITQRGSETNSLVELGFDGKIKDTLFSRDDKEVERILLDSNRFVYGVKYSGLYPEYEFFDQEKEARFLAVQQYFGDASVRLVSWSADFESLLIHVSGGIEKPAFYYVNSETLSVSIIADEYNGIDEDDVAEVVTITYPARDKYRIPSVLTRPKGWTKDRKYPTIILPHGGPESHDRVSFDWLAQFFASRGYLVLQPNFRGSDGFGISHRNAGRGQWGQGVMQHDVTDGLKALIKAGWTDPDRVCIIGASYGGYAALAGGAFTPELYACVGAIAPVADLPRMLLDEKRDNGRKSWVYSYWTRVIGDLKSERKKLEAISPSYHADNFQAPVLLIHGKDDLVVPMRQSNIMERALKKAGKEVSIVRLKGEDHYLSGNETRLACLEALAVFVDKHIGEGTK